VPKPSLVKKADPPSNGQPALVLSLSPTVVPKDKVAPKLASPVVVLTTSKTALVNKSTVPMDAVPPSEASSPSSTKSPSRAAQKLRDDPVRQKWVIRRRALEAEGADLKALNIGDADVKEWYWGGSTKNHYVVWKGVKVGVFHGWDYTKTLVSGIRGAGYRKAATAKEAFELLENKLLGVFGDEE